jgi:hypothetical protein
MKRIILAAVLLMTMVGGGAFAETKATKPSKNATTIMTPEQRQKMASMHEKMAVCLRSDKSMSECRAEMRDQCQEMMGEDGCPMMGHMGGMMGDDHMGMGMMKKQSSKK